MPCHHVRRSPVGVAIGRWSYDHRSALVAAVQARPRLARMRIATWNVNSLRSRIDRVEAFLQRHDIDVLAVQETKAREDQLPLMGLQARGLRGRRRGHQPVERRRDHQPGRARRRDGRLRRHAGLGRAAGGRVAGDRRDLRRRTDLVAVRPQRPQARRPALRLQARLAGPAPRGRRPWLDGTQTALVGDWNICPTDADVFDPAQFTNSTHVTPAERAAFQAFLDDGYAEVTRPTPPATPTGTTTGSASSATAACKIDFVLATPSLAERVTGAFIDREERAGQGASDHAPVGRRPRPTERQQSSGR